jgi:hypothetical protein
MFNFSDSSVRCARQVRAILVILLICMQCFSLLIPGKAQAASQVPCPIGYTYAFFNGVGNDMPDAMAGLAELRTLKGERYKGEPITYKLMYNHTGGAPQDVAEVFIQRGLELDPTGEFSYNNFSVFSSWLDGQMDPASLRTNPVGALSDIGGVRAFFEAVLQAAISDTLNLLAATAANPPTELDMTNQMNRLRADVAAGHKLLLVAHSQGNLFMTTAYDAILPSIGTNALKAIHIAPASPTTRGPYILSSKDLIINALRAKEGFSTVVPNNIEIPVLVDDPSGHFLILTYLNTGKPARAQILGMVDRALDVMSVNECELSVTPDVRSDLVADEILAIRPSLPRNITENEVEVFYKYTLTSAVAGLLYDPVTGGAGALTLETTSNTINFKTTHTPDSTTDTLLKITAHTRNKIDGYVKPLSKVASASLSSEPKTPELKVTPAQKTIPRGVITDVPLTASLVGIRALRQGESIQYSWTTTRAMGELLGSSDGGRTDPVLGPNATYRSNVASDSTDVVTVTARLGDEINISKSINIRAGYTIKINPMVITVPTDTSFPMTGILDQALESGATIEWLWSSTGAGSLATAQATGGPNSQVDFTSASSDGTAQVTVRAKVSVAASGAIPASTFTSDPVTAVITVKKGIRTITFEPQGGTFPWVTYPTYWAYIVPRFSKAIRYDAVISDWNVGNPYFDARGNGRTESWTTDVRDRGGIYFPIIYFPSNNPTDKAWAIWAGPNSKCVVTITLSE